MRRSMPTRNSRAGLLSRLPLRGLSHVKLVCQPTGATAIRSRSFLSLVREERPFGPRGRYYQSHDTHDPHDRPSRAVPVHAELPFLPDALRARGVLEPPSWRVLPNPQEVAQPQPLASQTPLVAYGHSGIACTFPGDFTAPHASQAGGGDAFFRSGSSHLPP